jgi:malate synthase
MRRTVTFDDIEIDQSLHDFVTQEALPGTALVETTFWTGFAALVRRLAPVNRALMERRDELQGRIDAWHREHPGAGFDRAAYKTFLLEIGYLLPDEDSFAIGTANVDAEIADIAGRRSREQCAVRAQRRQRPLGQPVRRPVRD